ncbi:NADPH-dependent FMN reductase [Penicillium longicatenatum]|uniref:NADPH-dependent FMN reductase n=1 Tax=Penicillium longicatenatum TaxID=1561947 RepID=UPI00254675F4|nr:NADPH-dependent FMN reductase [Penicillium longicatenatum]KAJ5658158.1 NADPH-dependent FMN reductase [Penicillium longicatenatum]
MRESTVEIVDLASQALALYNEPEVPSYLPAQDPTPHYVHAHTRAWSALVRRYDAFVFVTPQYNRSIPAVLKNALDYLYHEWAGKPAGIVSYGGHGGGKASEHLRGILAGLRMRPTATTVALKVSPKTAIEECEREGQVTPAMCKTWMEEGEEQKIHIMVSELLQLT